MVLLVIITTLGLAARLFPAPVGFTGITGVVFLRGRAVGIAAVSRVRYVRGGAGERKKKPMP
jgi:hypothetical protein